MFRPVPEFIAAVIPRMRSSRSASRTSALPKTLVYWGGGAAPPGSTFFGSAGRRPTIQAGLPPSPLPLLARLVELRVQAHPVEVAREGADVRGDRHSVVVQNDDDRDLEAAGVVKRLECDAAGQRAVADHRDYLAVGARSLAHRLLQTHRV